MFTMNVPKVYWGDAVLTAAYLINCMPLRTLDFEYPLELIQGTNFSIIHPTIFACVCFVNKHFGGKLDPRALKCIFVGYSANQKGTSVTIHPLENFMSL